MKFGNTSLVGATALSLAVAFSVPGIAVGQEANSQSAPSKDNECELISIVSELAMKSHQVGVPLTEVMGNIGKLPEFKEIVIRAYSGPRMATERAQAREIDKFRDEMTVACYKGEISAPREAFNQD